MVEARITEEGLAQLRARIGSYRPARDLFNEVATKDAIRHFAYGIGDDNPLWQDEEYAKKTRWGCILAPPAFLYSTSREGGGGGLAGVHGLYSGDQWEFFLPIRVNDHISVEGGLADVVEKTGQFAGRQILTIHETIYKNQDGAIIGKRRNLMMRTERRTAQEKGKYTTISTHHYTEEELKRIEADYDKEEIRGANPRYWEDVQVGEELAPVVKGPLTATDVIAFKIGFGFAPFVMAHKIALTYRRRHPAGFSVDPQTGVPDVVERVHWDDRWAKQIGAPGAYDYGPQRISWLSHLMTNWIGDDGFLKKLDAQLRRFNIHGDTTWCKGRVTNKYAQGGEYLVECEIWAENQRGEVIAPGHALVALPSRARAS